MDDLDKDGLRTRMVEAIEHASVEYQRCQLAAQRADLAGDDLAAAVLRSISESQTGMAHALLGMLPGVDPDGAAQTGTTADAVRGALERSQRHGDLMNAIAQSADAMTPPTLHDDLRAAAVIGATNTMRLKSLLGTLEPQETQA